MFKSSPSKGTGGPREGLRRYSLSKYKTVDERRVSLQWGEARPLGRLGQFLSVSLIITKASCYSNHFPSFKNPHIIHTKLYLYIFPNSAAQSMKCYHCFGNGFNHFSPLVIKIIPHLRNVNSVTGKSTLKKSSAMQKKPRTRGAHWKEAELLNGIKVPRSHLIMTCYQDKELDTCGIQ